MGAKQITNPNGVGGATALNQNGPMLTAELVTTVACAKGDVMAWNTQATDTVPTIAPAITGTTNAQAIAGVALEAAAANKTVAICRQGPCLVNIGVGGVVAAWERAILLAGNTGKADGVAADATTVDGTAFGVFLGGEIGTTDQAVLDVRCG